MNHRPILVFLHIPKTAGSSFNFVLENSLGLSACHTNHTKRPLFEQSDFEYARRLFPSLRCLSGHTLADPLRLDIPGAFHLTFLRDPIARVLSQYQDSILLGGNLATFEQMLDSNPAYENRQVKTIAGAPDLPKAKRYLESCGFVGLTEKFDLSLHVLNRLSPIRLNLNYVRRRTSKVDTAKRAILGDSRLMERARAKNALDLELYQFARDEIFPRLCAKAGVDPSAEAPSFQSYRSEIHPKFLLFSAWNMIVYRQLCKLYYRRRGRAAALAIGGAFATGIPPGLG
jgi:hypothetical protein